MKLEQELWVLEGHQPKRVDNLYVWARWRAELGNGNRVAEDHIGDVRVSTMFRGINHALFDDGPPLLFETIIFGGPHHMYQRRCATWTEAELCHSEAVRLVQAGDKVALFPRGMRFRR
jgi:hypothetical protein